MAKKNEIYKVTVVKHTKNVGNQPVNVSILGFSGNRYGINFNQGVGVTEDGTTARRIGAKAGYKAEVITNATAKKLGYVTIEDRAKAVESEAQEVDQEGQE